MLQLVLNFISSIVFAVAATFGVNRGIEQPHYHVIERIGIGRKHLLDRLGPLAL
jgi:hypothetical protein